jgi:predicted ribosome quality control (RQC) complex YloA/Tae2 family protein
MIRNYYTLKHIATELSFFEGWSVDECFTFDKDNIVIRLNDGKRESFIVITTDGKYDSIYRKDNFGKPKKNVTNLFHDLEGDIFQYAEVLNKSRVIKFNFIHTTAYLILYGGIHSNFVLVNSNGIVFESLRKNETMLGKKFKIENNNFDKFINADKELEIKSALANSDYLFGSIYSNEILNKLGINPKSKIAELSKQDFDNVIKESELFINSLENSSKFYLLKYSENKNLMSPVKLMAYEIISEYSSASEAVHRKIVSETIETEFSREYKKISSYLEKQKKKVEKAIENMKDIESAELREKQYRKWAELLISQQNGKVKLGDKVTLSDWNGEEYEIKLDPKFNLIENGKKYFNKAHSTLEDIRIRKKRLPEMQEKLALILNKLEELSKVNRIKDLGRFESGIKQVTGERMNTSKMTMEDKFRKFELGEGYILFAGKNAANNDELTMKFAKPNDIWLHARGSSGSHTVIRMDKEEKPPKMVLQKAAEITAYYSGARNAKYVPVIWTYKKYVRKPKGANVGAVIVAKETVIMAEPKLPEESQ